MLKTEQLNEYLYGNDLLNSVAAQEYEQELRLCGAAGGNVAALKKLGLDNYQLSEIRRGLEAGIDTSSYTDPSIPWFQMEETRLELEAGIDLSEYKKQDFGWDQLAQIRLGLMAHLDVGLYAKKEYLAEQMKEIRLGLAKDVSVIFYSNPDYDWFQMGEIRRGLEENVDISVYAKPDIPYMKMREVRKALAAGMELEEEEIREYDAGTLRQLSLAYEEHIPLKEYIRQGFDAEQLEQIRLALSEQVDMGQYLDPEFRGKSLEEIRLGLAENINVAIYADVRYTWQQMRELRKGLEARLDVSVYAKPLFRWQQMKEIRLGLLDNLDVSSYATLLYPSKEMRAAREKLLELSNSFAMRFTAEPHQFVTISTDRMSAFLELPAPMKPGDNYKQEDVVELLHSAGVVRGINEKAIHNMLVGNRYDQSILVAGGHRPQRGEDGYYTYFFRLNVPTGPIILEDGSVDYRNVEYFEQVKAGQKIAEYHSATRGKGGYAVTGEDVPGIDGREKPVLKGKGFTLMPDGKTYMSTVAGIIELDGNTIQITRLYITDEVSLATGDVYFSGGVLVRGSVNAGTIIEADEDIVVEGTVEGAQIKSGGNILLKEGVVGGGQGSITAAGNITGRFFEAVTLKAGGNIEANYCMNCHVKADGNINISGRKGMIVGGEIQSLMGVAAHCIGNRAGIRTVFDLGINQEILTQYSELLKEASKVQGELKLFVDERNRLLKQRLTQPAQLEWKRKIGQAAEMKATQFKDLLARKQAMEEKLSSLKGAKAVVQYQAYAGCTVGIDGTQMTVMRDIAEPRGITFRKVGGRVAVFRN